MLSVESLFKEKEEGYLWITRMKEFVKEMHKSSEEAMDTENSPWSLLRMQSSQITNYSAMMATLMEKKQMLENNLSFYSENVRKSIEAEDKGKAPDDNKRRKIAVLKDQIQEAKSSLSYARLNRSATVVEEKNLLSSLERQLRDLQDDGKRKRVDYTIELDERRRQLQDLQSDFSERTAAAEHDKRCILAVEEASETVIEALEVCKEVLSTANAIFLFLAEKIVRSVDVYSINSYADMSTFSCFAALKQQGRLKLASKSFDFRLGRMDGALKSLIQAHVNALSVNSIELLPGLQYTCYFDEDGTLCFKDADPRAAGDAQGNRDEEQDPDYNPDEEQDPDYNPGEELLQD